MPKSAKVDSQIETLQNQVLELDNQFKRALADYQNQEKRFEQKRQETIKFANQTLLAKLLSVIDDLERAQNHLQDAGLNQVLGKLHQVLSSEGLSVFEPTNQLFDPSTMDCAEVVKGKKDLVINTLLKGYLYHDRVLRPARVEVGAGE
ncbi:nucleotide exchange factor GrpE [Candidatus Collierbacteria bacterium]|nr:nucleotide exchange factor GrpE [Candidatus Collierbacteria bacterium]